MNKRPLAVICIFFIIGIVLARYLPESVRFIHVFIATIVFIPLTLALSPMGRGKLSNIFLLVSVSSVAALLYINSSIYPNNHISNFLGDERLKTSIVGVIKGPVLVRKPYYGKIASTYLFEIEAVKDGGEWWKVRGLAQIRIQTEKDYRYGDRLLVRGTIKRPLTPTLSPSGRGSFNYREYLERQDIFALVDTKGHGVTLLQHDYKTNSLLRYTYSIRERLKDRIIKGMPLETGAFLRAILLGDRSELPRHIQASFKKSGTMHVLAISGLHVGLIAFAILYLLKALRLKRELAYIFTIIFLMLFALATLSRPSVLRAVVMACIFLIGMMLGRKVDVYNSLGAAAMFILVRNPKELFNVGFQLSFMAVLSILFFAPQVMRLIKEDVNLYIKRWLYAPLAVSMAAWVGTFPVILYYFRIITPVAIIANLLIIPALFGLLIGGVFFSAVGWIPFLGSFLAWFNNLCGQAIFSLADFFGSLRFGHFYL